MYIILYTYSEMFTQDVYCGYDDKIIFEISITTERYLLIGTTHMDIITVEYTPHLMSSKY